MNKVYDRGPTRRGTLITVAGLPGTGKTTLSRRLERERQGIRFSADEWMIALDINLHEEGERDKVERLQWTLAKRALELGQTVIIDWGTWGKWERDRLLTDARGLGATSELIYLASTPDVVKRRIKERAMEDPPIADEAVTRWFTIFEVPDVHEQSQYDRYESIIT